VPRAVVVAVLLLASCQFNKPADQADAAVDAPPPECEASTQVCVADRFTACGPDSRFVRHEVPNGGPAGEPVTLVMDEYNCPLGCHATEPRCAQVLPSNGLGDLVFSAPARDLDLTDTSGLIALATSLDVVDGTIEFSEPSGTTHRVPAAVIAQTSGPEVLVLRVRSFSVRPGVSFLAIGTRALAIIADHDIFVGGSLLANYRGAAGLALDARSCWGMTHAEATGGGGNATAGGASSRGASGGNALTDTLVVSPLIGGCPAGGIGIQGGGLPGGALQLVSDTRVRISASGLLSVAGGGGRALIYQDDGRGKATGGGSGGALVIEAPALLIAPGGMINGRGGSGAAANGSVGGTLANGVSGDSPAVTDIPRGATCATCGRGGDGGTESSDPTDGTGTYPAIGGGGGAAGRMTSRVRALIVPPPDSIRIRSVYEPLLTR
jgi:hypothetical protein